MNMRIFITALLTTAAAPALAQTQPLLMPGEVVMPLANCAEVVKENLIANIEKAVPGFVAKRKLNTWTGACRDGLIDGPGTLVSPEFKNNPIILRIRSESHALSGRMLSRSTQSIAADPALSQTETTSVMFTIGTKTLLLRNVDENMSPLWRGVDAIEFFSGEDASSWKAIRAQKGSCWVDKDAFRGCGTGSRDYQVHYIEVYTPVPGQRDAAVDRVSCPKPRDPKSCDKLWAELAAPYIADAKAFIAEAEAADAKLRADVAALNSPLNVMQTRLAEAAREQQAAAEAAERQAYAEQIEREALAEQEKAQKIAEAEKEKAAREYKAKLAAMNAGQLFAHADELRAEGKNQEARETLRTLVSHFPDHPLAVTAASILPTLR